MSSNSILKNNINQENLEYTYYHKIRARAVAGLDRIDRDKFDKILKNELDIIERKVLNGSYKFTRYKKILISKGENKCPRVINIPTIRDKIVLNSVNDSLNTIYNNRNCSKLPHMIINDIKENVDSKEYNYFIKYDIKSFYSSIKHDILIKKLRYKIRNDIFLKVILNAIKSDGLLFPIKKSSEREERKEGIPEGLSISNSLANIYLLSLDKKMTSLPNIKYFRYVDDILILCNKAEKKKIDSLLKKEINKRLGLELNNKCDEGDIEEKKFEYLGYCFDGDLLSVRESSIYKIENSIETLLAQYRLSETPNEELLVWKLNLKISGCIYKNKKYGWIFFYSQINDMEILSHLDWLVQKLLKRYSISISTKKFKRTYYEIKYRLHSTNYIVKFDDYSFERKKEVLKKIYNKKIEKLTKKQIEDQFENVIFKDIALLEEDIQNFS